MTVQGMGMQQQSYPSHERHLVLPLPSAGLTTLSAMDVAALPGPLRLTGDDWVEHAISCSFLGR